MAAPSEGPPRRQNITKSSAPSASSSSSAASSSSSSLSSSSSSLSSSAPSLASAQEAGNTASLGTITGTKTPPRDLSRKRVSPKASAADGPSSPPRERYSKAARLQSPSSSPKTGAPSRSGDEFGPANVSPLTSKSTQSGGGNSRKSRRGSSPSAERSTTGSPSRAGASSKASASSGERSDAQTPLLEPLQRQSTTSAGGREEASEIDASLSSASAASPLTPPNSFEASDTSPQRAASHALQADAGTTAYAPGGRMDTVGIAQPSDLALRVQNIDDLDEEDEEEEEDDEDDDEEADASGASNNSFLSLSATISRGAYHQCGTARRVKVYELKGETWFDRGTGYCAGVYDEHEDAALLVARMEDACQKLILNASEEGSESRPQASQPEKAGADGSEREPYVLVVNENLDSDELLLRTKVVRDDVYQRQQDTLVVWTEPDGKDMALSFQEAEGCQEVWEFLTEVQKHFLLSARSEGLELDEAEGMGSGMLGISNAGMTTEVDLVMSDGAPFALPEPRMDNLHIIDMTLKDAASRSVAAREKVAEWILRDDYLVKLIPVFSDCEDLEQIDELHRLCAIMYTIIMLNDNALVERMLRDDVFLGVAGMLEYDPEFPRLKASYREYLVHTARFRQVVPIHDGSILTKIHQTFRLQYFKDVILARTLDDSTFAVLNSLIFYHHADIVMFCTTSEQFLSSLFQLFERDRTVSDERKAEAIIFIQQLCAVGKQVQLPSRLALFRTLTEWGLLIVLEYALGRPEPRLRNAAAEILTLIIEYDASGVRVHILEQVDKGLSPLLGKLASILHEEQGDLGLKTQITESLRILFDAGPDGSASGPVLAQTLAAAAAQSAGEGSRKEDTERFLNWFYDGEVDHIFAPLRTLKRFKDLEKRGEHPFLRIVSVPQAALYNHLCELLTFIMVQHNFRSQYWVISTEIGVRVASLLFAREKYLRLTALRFFRACLAKGNQFINRHFVKIELLGAILSVVEAESSRDNLVTSACLEFFEHVRKENIKPLINHLMERYEQRVQALTQHSTIGHYFQAMALQWEKSNEAAAAGHASALHDQTSTSSVEGGSMAAFAAEKERRMRDLAKRGEGRAAVFDADEEHYFQDDDDDAEAEQGSAGTAPAVAQTQSSEKALPFVPGLVHYSGDFEEEDDAERVPDSDGIRTAPQTTNGMDDAAHDPLPEAPVVPSMGLSTYMEDETSMGGAPTQVGTSSFSSSSPLSSSLDTNVKRKKGDADDDDDDDMMGRLAKRKSLAVEKETPNALAAGSDQTLVTSDASHASSADSAGSKRLSINLSSQSAEKLGKETEETGGK